MSRTQKKLKKIDNTIEGVNPSSLPTAGKIFEDAVRSEMEFKDLECDPEVKDIYEGQVNINNINKRWAQKTLKIVADLVNDVTNSIQIVLAEFDKYKLPTSYADDFFRTYRSFCHSLIQYNRQIKTAQSEDDIIEYLNTLRFAHAEVNSSFEMVKGLLTDRKKFSVKKNRFWSIVKWLWKYKYALYITGVLMYNVHTYVYIPGEMKVGLNFFIRLVGSICYTFASDRVSLAKLLEFTSSIVMTIIYSLYRLFTFGGISIGLPSVLRKGMDIGRVCVFYLFLHFAINWISYIIRLVCQGIVIFGASLRSGDMVVTEVWQIFENAAEEMGESLGRAYVYVAEQLKNASVNVALFLRKVFVDFFYADVIAPLADYVGKIPEKLMNIPRNMWSSWFGGGSGADTAAGSEEGILGLDFLRKKITNIPAQIGAARTLEDNLPDNLDEQTEQALSILHNIAGDGQIDLVRNEITDNVEENFENFKMVVQDTVDTLTGDFNAIAAMTTEKVKGKIHATFEDTLDKMGTRKLWSDLKELRFTRELLPWLLFIMWSFSILSLFGS